MKRLIAVVALAIVFTGVCGSKKSPDSNATTNTSAAVATTTPATIPTAVLATKASLITDAMIAKKWADAVAQFDPALAARFDVTTLKTSWDSLTNSFGAYKSRGATVVNAGVCETPLVFGSTHMKSRITFDAEGKASDLLIVKA